MSEIRVTIPPHWLDAEADPLPPLPSEPSGNRRHWCWIDGRYCERRAPSLSLGDFLSAAQASVCLQVRAYGTEARHFTPYYETFVKHVQDMGLPYPPYASRGVMAEAIRGLLHRNRYFGSALVRMVAYLQYRHDEFGVPIPTTSLLLDADPSPTKLYARPERPLFMGIYRDRLRTFSSHSHICQLGDPLWWGAQPFMSRMGYSNCLVLNDRGFIASALRGTLFVVKEKLVYTPPLSDGGCYDPIRQWAPQLVEQVGLRGVVEQGITESLVHAAEELFLLSTARGAEGILGVGTRRYYRGVSIALLEPLNRLFFPDQT